VHFCLCYTGRMPPTKIKNHGKRKIFLAAAIILFVAVQFFAINFQSDTLWFIWWSGIPLLVYAIMIVLIGIELVIAAKAIRKPGKTTAVYVVMVVVCLYALWSMYQSYAVFAKS
jgi:hypothetical protein